jgi:molybdopterin/thiamine biosynthesis adenylyltransferase
MNGQTDYFATVQGRVDLGIMRRSSVLFVGGGHVGSALLVELTRGCGLGHAIVFDGDSLEERNLPRIEELPRAYLGTNKAEALASHLGMNVPGLDIAGAPHHLDDSFTDLELDRLLAAVDLVVVATDKRTAQRRIAERARAVDTPALIPGLYADRGGEVFVQLDPELPDFRCWDEHRPATEDLRGVTAIHADAANVVQVATFLALAILDPSSRHARELAPTRTDPRPRQLFITRPGDALIRSPVDRNPNCPGCLVGPSAIADLAHPHLGASEAVHSTTEARGRGPAAGWRLVLGGIDTPPTFATVTVSEPLVVAGSTVTLHWEARRATHVSLDGHGVHPPAGEVQLLVTDTTHFSLHAVSPFGEATAVSPVVRAIATPRIAELRLARFPSDARPARGDRQRFREGPRRPQVPHARPGVPFAPRVPRLFPAPPSTSRSRRGKSA